MKMILALVAVVALSACSSTPKETTVSSDVAATADGVKADATATANEVKADAKKAAKKTEKKVKETVATAETETTAAASTAASEFGAINGTEKSSVTCTNKGDTRKITVMNVTEGGCGVVYNKAGADKTVAMAKSSMDYCDTVSGKIKSNLEGAGYDCGGGTAAPAAEPAGTSSSDQKTQ